MKMPLGSLSVQCLVTCQLAAVMYVPAPGHWDVTAWRGYKLKSIVLLTPGETGMTHSSSESRLSASIDMQIVGELEISEFTSET